MAKGKIRSAARGRVTEKTEFRVRLTIEAQRKG